EKDIDRPNYGPDPAEGAMGGNPIERTYEYDENDGSSSGVWECTPGVLYEEEHLEDEFCTVISGRVGIVDNATGVEEMFHAGDSFYLPKGSSLTWNVYGTLRKFYMVAE
ncbi:MAG: cupin domain-containing protein, partial [Acidimicrobiia bacterium]